MTLPALAAFAAAVDVEITSIKNDHGLVRVAICTREIFATKHCLYFSAAPARPGSVVVHLEGIPTGHYALQAYHDEDGDGRLRRGLFGIPSEAIGFSRDAKFRLGPPKFEDAAIDVAEPTTATSLRLRHIGW